jgi:small subunit ribosomal protein S18
MSNTREESASDLPLSAPRRRRIGQQFPPEYKFDYKDIQTLRYFLTDRGKIMARRVSGLTARQQRDLTLAVKRARNIALLPYTTSDV